MKNLKNLLVLFMGIVTMSLTFASCNTDGEDYSIDEVTQKRYQSLMSGSYSGKVLFQQFDSRQNKYVSVDSTNTTWYVRNDSTFSIRNFPISKLDSAINVPSGDISSEGTQLRALRKAISELPDETIRCNYYVPNTQFVGTNGYQFLVNPLCTESDFPQLLADKKPMFIKKKLTYNDETHDVYFVFYQNYYGGAYNSPSLLFNFYMMLAGISIDTVPTQYTSSFSTQYFRNIAITCTKN